MTFQVRCSWVRSRRGFFFPAKTKVLYVLYIESWFLCFKCIKHVLSKLCASGCAPAGAFFPAKIHLLYFINREPPLLCLRYIQTQLLGPKVAFRIHETLLLHTPPDPPDQPKWRSELPSRPSLPHAPGFRMTVVKQTPSNYSILYYVVHGIIFVLL